MNPPCCEPGCNGQHRAPREDEERCMCGHPRSKLEAPIFKIVRWLRMVREDIFGKSKP